MTMCCHQFSFIPVRALVSILQLSHALVQFRKLMTSSSPAIPQENHFLPQHQNVLASIFPRTQAVLGARRAAR